MPSSFLLFEIQVQLNLEKRLYIKKYFLINIQNKFHKLILCITLIFKRTNLNRTMDSDHKQV